MFAILSRQLHKVELVMLAPVLTKIVPNVRRPFYSECLIYTRICKSFIYEFGLESRNGQTHRDLRKLVLPIA